MREIALYDAKNSLSALIAAVEATGETIVITRHGKRVAQLGPTHPNITTADRAAAIRDLIFLRHEIARQHPDAPAMSWEELKALMRDEEG
jgi:prevent-host-death family protein